MNSSQPVWCKKILTKTPQGKGVFLIPIYVVVQWARSVICHTIYFLPTAPQLNELFFPSFKYFGRILHNLPNSARKTKGHDLSKMYWSCRRKRGSIFTFKWAAIREGSKGGGKMGGRGRWVLRITNMGGSTILHL